MSKRSVSIIAFVSVLINILLIGGIAGRMYSGFDHPRDDFSAKGRMHSVLSKLPEEKARWYKQAIQDSRENRKENYKAIKNLRLEAIKILEAEEFDLIAFKQKLQQLDELGATIKKHQMDIIIEFAQKLTATERRDLSKFLLNDKRYKKQG